MLARKISASMGTSAGRKGRNASWGCARAIIATPLSPGGAARSSLHLPDRRAVFLVLELDAHRLELVADSVGFLEILRLAGGIARVDKLFDRSLIETTRRPQNLGLFLCFPSEETLAIKT